MFKKVNNNLYIVDSQAVGIVDSAVTNIINSISPVSKSVFNVSINDNLYETILSRYLASDFIHTMAETLKKEQHIVISIDINNKSYKITIGNLSNGKEPEYVHGIMTD